LKECIVKPAAVIFDLDGTLLDTLADIGRAANAVLTERGWPAHPLTDYRRFVGDGVRVLMERVLPAEHRSPTTVDEAVDRFGALYAECWDRETRLYAGVRTLLSALAARGAPLAVLSNKPQRFTELCVERFLSEWRFAVVFGQRAGIPRKPDPAGALEIAARLGLAPAACAYVGDSGVDMHTAQGAGMLALGAAWGFRGVTELKVAGASAILHHPCDLLPWFDESQAAEPELEVRE
jgi:phosphoglycolate phosphatase